jgi:hypothetical protein
VTKILTEDEKLLLECQRALEAGDNIRALTAADELLMRDPENGAALFAAGTALLRGDQKGVALQLLNAARAVCAKDDRHKLGVIWNNIGYCLQGYHPDRAYKALQKAVECGYDEFSFDNLCNVASTLGRHTEALEWSEKVRSGDPSYNRSFALFHLGRWAEAWEAYDKSAGTPTRPMTDRHYGLPRWDGKRPGKVIVHGEQGVGDEIMFMSLLPADFDGVIDCNPRTAALFQRSFPAATVYGTLLQPMLEWPLEERADYHIEMGGLGRIYAPEPFRRGAYLKADPSRLAAWDAWLRAEAGHQFRALPRPLRVGISWTGGTWETGRKKRSVPFAAVQRFLFDQHQDVTWVNLEYEPRKEYLELAEANGTKVLDPFWATKKGAELDDLAALCGSLDLVITATNSTVDVCGALGVPVWALTNVEPMWRYAHAAGEDRMWFYESARLFRQRTEDNGSWDRVLGNVALALAKHKAVGRAA